MKINVKWNNETSTDYYLLKNVKLSTQLDVLCQIFKIEENPQRYALFFKDQNSFISDELLRSDYDTLISENSKFELLLAPIYLVDAVMEYLKQELTIKKGLYELKSQLQIFNSGFTKEFINKGGLDILQSIIMDHSGNTLAYALGVFDLILSETELEFSELNVDIVEKIIISNLNSTDINTQSYSLTLINTMIASSPNISGFLETMEEYNLFGVLKKQLNTTDLQFRKQIYKLQNLKVQEFIKDSSTQYNKDDPAHEKILERLWELLFPNDKFAAVDDKWKTIGFQGKDPSNDFRGMGVGGLKHLVYFASHHSDIFLTLTNQQNSAKDRCYYPVAISSNADNHSDNQQILIFPVLFDQKNALEEIYCITIEIFAMMWEEGNARYMDFTKVIGALKALMNDTLYRASSILEFKNNIVKKRIDYKKILDPKRTNPRHSKSFNNSFADNDRRAIEFANRHVDSQMDLLNKSIEESHEPSSESAHAHTVSSPEGNTPLHISIGSMSYESASHYLTNQSMINSANNLGLTPLNLACTSSSSQMIELVLSFGINAVQPANNGYLPIHNFASRNWVNDEFNRIIKLFIEKNVEIDSKNMETLETPLHVACTKGCIENVKTLLQFGSNPNVYNKKGETPLNIAVVKKHKDIIQALIQHGADIGLSHSLTNETCEQLANDDQEILSLIKSCREKFRVPDEAHNTPKRPTPLPKRPSISKESNQISICSPASSNRSISPTPPTSPFVTSPAIKSTPIRHTNSVIGLQFEPCSPMSPTSPTPYKPPNALNSPPDLNIGSSGSSSGGLLSIVSRGSLRSSSSSVANMTSIIRKLETLKTTLVDTANMTDQINPSDAKYKESIRKISDNVNSCKSIIKSLK
eukprot:gene16377-19486_t